MAFRFHKPLLQVLVLLLVTLSATGARAQNYCDPAYSFLAPGTNPLTIYDVGKTSHVVVMEYGVWLGPNAYLPNSGGVPTLATIPIPGGYTYDSGACGTIGQHARWMMDMGIDAVTVDLSNAVRCIFTNSWEDTNSCGGQWSQLQQVKTNLVNLYAYYAQHNVPVRIVPMLGAQGDELWTVLPDGKTGFQRGLDFFESLANQYPNQVVRYQGRPLLMVYTAVNASGFTPYVVNNINGAGKQNTFAYRITAAFTDSQPSLWDPNQGGALAGLNRLAPWPYPMWSWLDRLSADLTTYRPGYSMVDGRPDNLVVTSAFSGNNCPNGDCWAGSDARLRQDYSSVVLDDYMNKAKTLQPRFLLFNQFNEFWAPDQGNTRYNTEDIEPTSSVSGGPGWGNAYIDLASTKIAEYKAALTRPVDFASRAWVGTDSNVLISGITIAGPAPKTVLIRGFGPSLAQYFPSDPVLQNPRIELAGWTANDDWQQAPNASQIVQHGWQPGDARESAILVTLPPGTYSVIMKGADGGSGIGMLDVYEVDNPGSPFSGVSSRGWVGTGNNLMINSLVIGGTQPQTVLIRAAGPSLNQYGLQGLPDPYLQLLNSAGQVIAANDNWQQASNWQDIQAAGAPVNALEPAILITLNPGVYSIFTTGLGPNPQGIAVSSVYVQ